MCSETEFQQHMLELSIAAVVQQLCPCQSVCIAGINVC